MLYCYREHNGLAMNPTVQIKLGNYNYSIHEENKKEAGTGYFKKAIEGKDIKPDMGNISVTVKPDQGFSFRQRSERGFFLGRYLLAIL